MSREIKLFTSNLNSHTKTENERDNYTIYIHFYPADIEIQLDS
jgi:hypothetical protein